jgi:hypothetical protein
MVTCGTTDIVDDDAEGGNTVSSCVLEEQANKKLQSVTVKVYIDPGRRYFTGITIGTAVVCAYCESRKSVRLAKDSYDWCDKALEALMNESLNTVNFISPHFLPTFPVEAEISRR